MCILHATVTESFIKEICSIRITMNTVTSDRRLGMNPKVENDCTNTKAVNTTHGTSASCSQVNIS